MSTQSDLDELLSTSQVQLPQRRRAVTFSVLAVLLVILVVLAVLADGAARGFAQDAVEQEIADRLPAGAGPITATIGGFAFLPQFFSGTLDELDVTFALNEKTLPGLVGDVGSVSGLRIGDGALSYDGAVELLGVQLGYTVTLAPSVDNGQLVLTPTAVAATAGEASVDFGQILDLNALTMRACAASLLPKSMTLTEVQVVGSQLQFEVSGREVPLNLSELKTRGSCD